MAPALTDITVESSPAILKPAVARTYPRVATWLSFVGVAAMMLANAVSVTWVDVCVAEVTALNVSSPSFQ